MTVRLRSITAAGALCVFLSITTPAFGKLRDDPGDIGDRIVRVIKKLQKRFADIISFDDGAIPPKP